MMQHGRNGWKLVEYAWNPADGSAEFTYTNERRTSTGGRVTVDLLRSQRRFWTRPKENASG